jgi:hypothetical protein
VEKAGGLRLQQASPSPDIPSNLGRARALLVIGEGDLVDEVRRLLGGAVSDKVWPPGAGQVPYASYAPSEDHTKRWTHEAQQETWSPHLCGHDPRTSISTERHGRTTRDLTSGSQQCSRAHRPAHRRSESEHDPCRSYQPPPRSRGIRPHLRGDGQIRP